MARILFFSPHPDDTAIFAGATFFKHIQENDIVQLGLLTRGEQGTKDKTLQGEIYGQIRLNEVANRLQEVPSVKFHWLGLHDQEVECTPEAIQIVQKYIYDFKPEIIYLPESHYYYSFYHHPDHIMAGKIIEQAVASYPVILRHYHTRYPDLFINVSAYFNWSQKSLNYFKSQHGKIVPVYLWYVKAGRYWRARRLGWDNGSTFVEAFREIVICR